MTLRFAPRRDWRLSEASMRFNDLPVADGVKDAIAAMGYEEATPIQRDAIPVLLSGKDVIGRARTGTGKTAAFGIPMVERLRDARDGVRGLVLVPTRELALQVTEVLADLAKGSRLRVAPVFGGVGFGPQTAALRVRAPIVVVACPGRLLDLMGRGDVGLADVEVLVLDEADRMLDMGFIHDMRRIARELPTRRQTSLFSATIDGPVRKLAGDFLVDPTTVEAEDGTLATPLTSQHHIRVEKPDKTDVLLQLLGDEKPGKAVVFTRTKHLARRMAERLNKSGWASVALQGNMTQNQRERAMAAFRAGEARILVATDVAARGLDVPDITHVVNFDLPTEPESYVHRIGRTGRNGRAGRSVTFVQSDEHRDFKTIERLAGAPIPRMTITVDGSTRGPDTPFVPTAPAPRGDPGAPRRRHGGRRHGRQVRDDGASERSPSRRRHSGGRAGDRPRYGGQRQQGQGDGHPGSRRAGRGPRHGTRDTNRRHGQGRSYGGSRARGPAS